VPRKGGSPSGEALDLERILEDVHDVLLVVEQDTVPFLAEVQQPFDVSQSRLRLLRLLARTEAVVPVL
jgi:hypothetical protein